MTKKEHSQFISFITTKFKVQNFYGQSPIKCFSYKLTPEKLMLNHYMVKSNHSSNFILDGLPSSIIKYINQVIFYCVVNKLPFEDRYCFLTVNSNPILSGKTQRNAGWHTDGFQGLEVIEKQDNDFYFVNYDALPTEYSNDVFILDGFNEGEHNYFNVLETQIKTKLLTEINHTYLFSSNFVHRASIAVNDCNRYFVRIGFSKVPITSVKMTLNPHMDYNYQVHTTSGEIPSNLKKSI